MSFTSASRPKQRPPAGQIILALTRKSSLPPFPPNIGFTSPAKHVLIRSCLLFLQGPQTFSSCRPPSSKTRRLRYRHQGPTSTNGKQSHQEVVNGAQAGSAGAEAVMVVAKREENVVVERVNERRGTRTYYSRVPTLPFSSSTHTSRSSTPISPGFKASAYSSSPISSVEKIPQNDPHRDLPFVLEFWIRLQTQRAAD
ncbi:hypothetical protein MIND_01115300 [Mycena indigotica]|uniref:Uncharacterized protein n=1 Tax=Mycena indigotica TaxID=2126181 RepID=A0A8H6VTJ6_9AGAR|nr:uncharacterized protein MIND_01115300 [Mycena indigotica]KAF7293384.1 hypothetical protein MIND_01115300 [Mycena indigotica]